MTGSEMNSCHWIAMDIDYPGHIVERVNAEVRRRAEIGGMRYIVDVVGHGAARYADAWQSLDALGSVVEDPFWRRGRPAWRCSPRWR